MEYLNLLFKKKRMGFLRFYINHSKSILVIHFPALFLISSGLSRHLKISGRSYLRIFSLMIADSFFEIPHCSIAYLRDGRTSLLAVPGYIFKNFSLSLMVSSSLVFGLVSPI